MADSPLFLASTSAHCLVRVDSLKATPFANGIWFLPKHLCDFERCVRFFDGLTASGRIVNFVQDRLHLLHASRHFDQALFQ